MRIVAGNLGGRNFDSPPGHRTHPMSEKVRGAIFNMLGDIGGLTVLDAFAGSGALAFEAISRGAGQVTAIDIDKDAAKTMEHSAQTLKITNQIKIIRANSSSWSDNNPGAEFDICLLDPPYDDVKPQLLNKMMRHVKPGGILIFSLPPEFELLLPASVQLLSTKSYGDAQVLAYRKI